MKSIEMKKCIKCSEIMELNLFVKAKNVCKCCLNKKYQKIRDTMRGSRRRYAKYYVNQLKLLDDTLLTWYIAGLLAADGCIVSGVNRVSLTLQDKDMDTIKEFKNYFEFTGEILYYRKKYPYVSISGVPDVINILEEKFNISDCKSLSLKPPKQFPSLDHKLAYIVGYIDGDGCIYTSDKLHQLQILGTESMLNFILETFSTYCDIKIKPRIASCKTVYQINLSGNFKNPESKYYALISKLKSLEVPKMKRKWDKFNW